MGFGIQAGMKQLFQHVGLNAQQGFFFGNEPFIHHIDGSFNEGGGVHFGASGLEAIQFSIFYGKLEVLNFTVVIFKGVP